MRQRFMFWLDHDKPQEQQVAQDIRALKKAGLFARTIRDGIRLIQDLRAGRTVVLHELFPWVLEQQENTDQPAVSAIGETTESSGESITRQLERLEALLLNGGALPVNDGQRATQTPIPVRHRHDDRSQPGYDDVEIEITRTKQDENNRSAWNFMISGAALQGTYNDLPSDVIEYGIRTGRISVDAVKPKPARTAPAGSKPMDVPRFDAPDFDDLDLAFDSS